MDPKIVPLNPPAAAGRNDTRAGTRTGTRAGVSAEAVLDALPAPVIVTAARGYGAAYANAAAEQFFAASAQTLARGGLGALLPADSPLFDLIEQVRASGAGVTKYGLVLESPRLPARLADVQGAPAAESVILIFHERAGAGRLERRLSHQSAARSVSAMAAMLAHEVRNPLSGIRGAAQLLEAGASEEDKDLAALICAEADRISGLVGRMDAFADSPASARAPVNIHEVLDRVQKLAVSGFARGVRFSAEYDPSLPAAHADRDQMIQVFLNLVKNAAEAAGNSGGEIKLSTAWRRGVRFAADGGAPLPLEIAVEDNGPGAPEDIRPFLFDPFVTTKAQGGGLGLALAAKIIDSHGGAVECENTPGGCVFRVMLPAAPGGAEPAP